MIAPGLINAILVVEVIGIVIAVVYIACVSRNYSLWNWCKGIRAACREKTCGSDAKSSCGCSENPGCGKKTSCCCGEDTGGGWSSTAGSRRWKTIAVIFIAVAIILLLIVIFFARFDREKCPAVSKMPVIDLGPPRAVPVQAPVTYKQTLTPVSTPFPYAGIAGSTMAHVTAVPRDSAVQPRASALSALLDNIAAARAAGVPPTALS